MALNDDINESEYTFSDGDLTAFNDEFAMPKQDMGLSEEVEDDPYFGEEEEDGFSPMESGEDGVPVGNVMSMAQAREISKGLTIGADSMISGVMGMFNGGDASPFRMTADERAQVVTSLATVLKHNNAHVSPTWGLVIVLITIYAGKAMTLHQLRAERKKTEKPTTSVETDGTPS